MAVKSPCVGVCTLDACGGTCVGCGRTLGEIAAWPELSDSRRQLILIAVARRRDGQPDEPPAAQ